MSISPNAARHATAGVMRVMRVTRVKRVTPHHVAYFYSNVRSSSMASNGGMRTFASPLWRTGFP